MCDLLPGLFLLLCSLASTRKAWFDNLQLVEGYEYEVHHLLEISYEFVFYLFTSWLHNVFLWKNLSNLNPEYIESGTSYFLIVELNDDNRPHVNIHMDLNLIQHTLSTSDRTL